MSLARDFVRYVALEWVLPFALALALVALVFGVVYGGAWLGESIAYAFPWSERSIVVLRVDRVRNMVDAKPKHYDVTEVDAGAATGARQGFLGVCEHRFTLRDELPSVGACYQAEIMGRGHCLVQFSQVQCEAFGLREIK